MPADEVYVDPARLDANIARLRDVAGRLRTMTDAFAARLRVPGQPGDPYADSLHTWLKPASESFRGMGEGLSSGVGNVAEGIRGMKEAYQAADRAVRR
ncbi:hypothetical protein HC031_20200 [Planosporangium thailandense]|uniref:WXG100 family type VII secretion target n=1 Tax=Planosporangium thailandense TaxID=765197 RepID=A0ABX0Y3N5_9ACTN|nr:hypothetical protein [Planosporangium thailandense]NJC72020.1 hypothetical protein [Planosporangium thailandense]